MPFSLEKPNTFFDHFSHRKGNGESTHYCPGCGHGIVHKLIAEEIADLEIQNRTILISALGCSVFMGNYFDLSAISAPHGCAPAVAAAVSRSHPNAITISYQGDGDLSAAGMGSIIHAANRGENMIAFLINNNNYGLTGGQLAPTSLLGQKTLTSPFGRSVLNDGLPLRVSEMIALLPAPVLAARSAVSSPRHIRETKRLIHRAMQAQAAKKGFAFIEILSPCPENWQKSPVDACRWIEEEVVKTFPLGIFKDEIDSRAPMIRKRRDPDFKEVLHVLDLKPLEPFENRSPFFTGKEVRIKIAGSAGQGVFALGEAFAELAARKGLNVSALPSRGPCKQDEEVSCSVVMSNDPIGSPVADHPDLLIAMDSSSLIRFGASVPENGSIFYDPAMIDSFPKEIKAKGFPLAASERANHSGNIKTVRTVFLAYVSRVLKLFSHDELHDYAEKLCDNTVSYSQNRDAVNAGWTAP
ncbi:MAG: thiamine pyrophosphate-dependent enzyme [Planctomycetia bacterium]|nr:thiamine pyrophosphate-dependent enzyme [Planctomycetia bacterium]